MKHTHFSKTPMFALCLTMALALTVAPCLAPAAAAERDSFPGPDGVRLDSETVAGLLASVRVVRDANHVPHIFALNDHDALFMLGWVHAEDRFFQMDTLRRTFSGTLAELVGAAALPQDVQFRTLGLRRAAEATDPLLPAGAREWVDAYAEGVNAWLASAGNPLPPEYAALALTKASVPAWTPVDSLVIAKGLAFGLSFDLDDLDLTQAALTFEGVGESFGFDGLALFSEDLYRSAPFDPSVSIPGFLNGAGSGGELEKARAFAKSKLPAYLDASALKLIGKAHAKLAKVEALAHALAGRDTPIGSNWWMAAGALTASGDPLLANDPHLGLDTPAIFYEVEMRVSGAAGSRPMLVFGVSFAGTPGVILGCNRRICWGATTNPMDVTDVYLEDLRIDLSVGVPDATIFDGQPEPLVVIPQTYLVNALNPAQADTIVDSGIGPADPGGLTFIVPRRNNGPIVDLSIDSGDPRGLSVQYTGWGPTFEIESIREWARAGDVGEFADGLQSFDVGSQNWSVIDSDGNIAYFTSAEMPVREDLQNLLAPDGGIPPYIVRDGTHTLAHEWLAVAHPQPGQALPYEILPFSEMPQVTNPESGWVANCNNDPVGTTLDNNPLNQLRPGGGLYYLNAGYAPGFRIGRIRRLIEGALAARGSAGTFTPADFKAFQANNQLLDAEALVPCILTAFDNATAGGADATLAALGADPGVAGAVGLLAAWDFSTPTGIAAGFDPGDDPAALPEPGEQEIAASASATIYAAWRAQVVKAVIDGTLERVDAAVAQFVADAPSLAALSPGSNLALSALRNLLDNFDANQGFGASGLSFFEVPGVADRAAARDVVLLQALRDALDLLASDGFAPAFGNSTDLLDYRWGKLHRIVFDHVLGGPFSIPNAGGLADLGPDLRGVARAGGFGSLDAASHSARADGLNEFMFGSGPARRFVGEVPASGPVAEEVIPGGESGILGSPFQSDELLLWLTNSYKPFFWQPGDVIMNIGTYQQFLPP